MTSAKYPACFLKTNLRFWITIELGIFFFFWNFCDYIWHDHGNLISEFSISVELSAFGEQRVVLSPRKVMLAMSDYIQNFSLTSQQVIAFSEFFQQAITFLWLIFVFPCIGCWRSISSSVVIFKRRIFRFLPSKGEFSSRCFCFF